MTREERREKSDKHFNRPQRKVVIGKRYGTLIVGKLVGKNDQRHSIWSCLCDCGAIVHAEIYALISGNRKTCGSEACREKLRMERRKEQSSSDA